MNQESRNWLLLVSKAHKTVFWSCHHHHLSLNREGCFSTSDDFTTSLLCFSLFSTALWDLPNSRPIYSLTLCSPPLPLSALSSFLFHCALQDGFGQTWWTGYTTIPLQFASLYNGQEVFVWFDCLLDLCTMFLIDKMVFVWDTQYLAVSPHFHGLYSSLELWCEGPWFASIQEDGCDKGLHQPYLGTVRKTPVNPNWFQLCQCCCCLCYSGEYLRLGTLISYNWAQVLEACDSLKLLSIYFDLCVDATGVVCHQLGLHSTDLLWRLCRDTQLILPVLPFVLSHQCHQQSRDWLLFCLQYWQCRQHILIYWRFKRGNLW